MRWGRGVVAGEGVSVSRGGGDGGDRVALAQQVRTGGSRKAGRGWTGAHTGSHGPRGAGAKSKEAEVTGGQGQL